MYRIAYQLLANIISLFYPNVIGREVKGRREPV